MNLRQKKGFSVVEVILTVGILGLLITALVGGLIYGKESTYLAGGRARAVYLAEEGLEAVRNIAEADYENLANGNHGLVSGGVQWGFSGVSDTVGVFTRSIEISDYDEDTKQVTSSVTWQQSAQRTGTVTLTTLFANWATLPDYIYAFRGDTNTDFWRFEVSENTWISVANAPGGVKDGGSLVHDGASYIYAFQGNDSSSLWRYDVSSNSWGSLANTPGNINEGGSITYDGSTYLYAMRGGSTSDFWRYDIAGNSWTSLASTPDSVKEGGDITYDGSTYIYAFHGDDTQDFWRYSISSNSWSSMANTPTGTKDGASLVHGDSGYIYAWPGSDSNNFWRYNVSGNSWSSMASTPANVNEGGDIGYDGSNYIYGLRGGVNNDFWQYSISGNSWTAMADTPENVKEGGALALLEEFISGETEEDTTPPNDITNLALSGPTYNSIDLSWTAPGDDGATGTASGYDIRYSTSTITEGNWGSATQVTGEPAPSVAGSSESMTVSGLSSSTTYYFAIKTFDEVPNTSGISNVPSLATLSPPTPEYVFGLQGNDSNSFWRYDISGNSWSSIANTPGNVKGGGALTYDDSTYIYALRGGDSNNFWRYDVSGNSWSSMANTPGNVNIGGALTYDGSSYIYALQGNDNNAFWRYDVSGNSWSSMSATPGGVKDGGALVYGDSGYIYALQGNDSNTFWRYNVSGDSWTSMSTAPSTVKGGGALTYDESDYIYALRGNGSNNFWRYSISGNSWSSMSNASGSVKDGGALAYDTSNYVYGWPCNDSNNFLRYSISGDSWSSMTNATGSVKDGGALVLTIEVVVADTTAPSSVADLALSGATNNSINLAWTAPGDDGAVGTATSYDIRYSTSTITEGNWASATQATGEPTPSVAGSSESMTVSGLSESTTYYFAIKTSDEVPNTSGISNVPSLATTASPTFRIKEYYLSSGIFSGNTYNLTLDQDLTTNYFIIVQGSDGNGTTGVDRGPDENYVSLTADPNGTGDLSASGGTDVLSFTRGNAVDSWIGVVTVVECLKDCSASGFELVDIARVTHSGTSVSGTDTFVSSWTDINQVMLMGGFNGSGCDTSESNVVNQKVCHTQIWPSSTNTINWERNATNATLSTATSTVMALEWGSEWTIKRVEVTGSSGGGGANATGEYDTAAISSVVRANTWVWGTGIVNDQGIGNGAEGTLITLGDGVNKNTNETTVAVGQEYSDTRNFEVYALTHPQLSTDYQFKADGDSTSLTYDVTVATVTNTTARMGLVYNGCNGTGDAFPRPLFSARYVDNSTIRLERRRSGQNFPAWIQGIDFSGIN